MVKSVALGFLTIADQLSKLKTDAQCRSAFRAENGYRFSESNEHDMNFKSGKDWSERIASEAVGGSA